MPDMGFYLLIIPLANGEKHQVPFDSVSDIELWLAVDWPSYEAWLVGDSGEPIQDDTLYVDYVSDGVSGGVQYRDGLVTRNEFTGELVVN